MKKTLKFTDEDFKNVFPRLELENVEDVIPPIDNTSDKIPPAVGINKADEQPIVVKLPYEIENQGLYTDPKEKGIIGALGESVWQGVKSNGTAFVNNMDTLAYRGLEKQKKEAEKYLSNHDDLVSEIYKKNIDKFGENGSYADFLKKNIVENTQKQSQNSQAIAEKYADIKGAGTAQYVGEAVGTMLPGIGASIATGIPNIGLAFMAPNVFGNAMGRAVSDGADMKKAQSYALADTALEVGIEMLFGGIPSFGEGVISAKNLTSKYLKTTAGRFLANKLVDVTGEGFEEVASEILEPFLERAFIDKSAPNANLKEVAKAFGGGVLISSILGAANISNEINEAKPNAKNYTVASQEYEPQSDKWFGNISDITQARKAYKRYAQEYHPDVSSQTNAAQIMGEINRAYTGWRKYAAQQQYNLGETTDSSKTASKQANTNGRISLLNAGRAEKAVNSLPDGAKMIGRETQGITNSGQKMTAGDIANLGDKTQRQIEKEESEKISNDVTFDTQQTAVLDNARKKANSKEIIDKLKMSIPEISDIKSVCKISGNEFSKSNTSIVKQVGDFFKQFGNKVSRDNFGDIIIDETGVKSDIGHGIGRAKSATFAAVPSVIKNGVQIDYQENWKGRGYDSYVFAAPIEMSGKKSYVATVVLKDKSNRFYLHEVVDEYGNIIFASKKEPGIIKTGVTVQDGVTSEPSSFDAKIPQSENNVKGYGVIDKNGNIVKDENTITEKDNDAKISKNANETQKNTRQIAKTVDNFADNNLPLNKKNVVMQKVTSAVEDYDMTSNNSKIVPNMTDSERYQILKNKEIKILSVSSKSLNNEELNALKTATKKEAKSFLKVIASKFGVLKKYENSDIELQFNFSNGSLVESINKQKEKYDDLAKVYPIMNGIVENAIGIEVHSDRYSEGRRADSSLKNSYILVSAYEDNGSIVPVKILVKEFKGKDNKIYLLTTFQKIKGVDFSAQTSIPKNGENNAPSTPTIKIAELLNKVNRNDNDLIKYIPQEFLVESGSMQGNIASKGEHKTVETVETVEKSSKSTPYYPVSENLAKGAKLANSFSDYKQGSATAGYKSQVDSIVEVAKKAKIKNPDSAEYIDYLADKYAKKMAQWTDKYNRNAGATPSVMISGAGNFPTARKEKQNAREGKLWQEYDYIQGIEDKIRSAGNGGNIIKSSDAMAIDKLEDKLKSLQDSQQLMKDMNAYYRKNDTLDGFEGADESLIKDVQKEMSSQWHMSNVPFAPYSLSNNNQNIKSVKDRIEALKKVKDAGSKTVENDSYKYEENAEDMRIRFYFDGKPDSEVIAIMKKQGFKWAPSIGAWQRQLTDNGKRGARNAKEALEAFYKGEKADVKPTLPDLIKEQKEDDLPQSIGAMKHNPKSFSAMANEYGTIKDGENPSRVVDVPKSTDGTNKVRQATRTFMEAEVTPDEMIELFEQAVADNEFSYEAKKDKSTVENAAKYIEQNGYKETLAEWQKKVDNGKSITKEDVAGAQLMYVAAAKVGDTDTAMKLAADIAAMATNAAQVVQAQRLLKKATPEGRLYTANRSIEHIQKKIDEKYGKKAPKINVPNKLMDNLYSATTQDEINNALDKINRNVSEQLPVTWADRYIAYRYLSMLGNFRTQMRNLGSNLLQMPARKLTGIINAGLEIGLEKAGVKVQRTTSLKKATQEQKDFAKADYIEMEDILASNGKYQSDNLSDIEKLKNPFKINGTWGKNSDSSTIAKSSRMVTETIAKGLTAWNKATTYAMDKGDILFSRPAYINAIASYMQANNLTAADMKGKTLLGAREWATKQSLESVFREANSIATWLQNTEGKNWITKLVLGGTIPFKRTPLNIAVRSFEYTPMNIIKGAVQLQKAAKTGDVYKVQSAIDSIAKGTSGSTILTIGFFMASLGLLKAGMGNSKKDKLEKEMGAQEYSLQIGDYSMTVEWAGPSVTTLFIGAQIYENLTKDDEEDIDLINTVASLLTLFDPIFESTMLGGLNDTLTQIGYSNNPIAELPVRAAANYVSQFIPTIFGQVARTIDDTRRAVYTTKTGTSKIVDTTAKKMGNKMPFISKSNIPYLDMFGKEVKNAGDNYATRLAYNMFSPGYITKKPDDKVLQAIAEVYDETGDTEIIPIKPTNQYTKDDKQLKMTSEEYEAFAKENGQTAHSFIENMLLDKHYDNLSSAEKAEVIKDIYAYSRKISLYDTLNIELSATNKDKKTALDAEVPPMYVFSKEADANNNGHFDKEETKNYIDSLNDLSNTQKAYLFASMSSAKNPYA